jgi:hypothetical protein
MRQKLEARRKELEEQSIQLMRETQEKLLEEREAKRRRLLAAARKKWSQAEARPLLPRGLRLTRPHVLVAAAATQQRFAAEARARAESQEQLDELKAHGADRSSGKRPSRPRETTRKAARRLPSRLSAAREKPRRLRPLPDAEG